MTTIFVVLIIESAFGIYSYQLKKSNEYAHMDSRIEGLIIDTTITIRDPLFDFDKERVKQLVDTHIAGNIFLKAMLVYQEEGNEKTFVGRLKKDDGSIINLKGDPASYYYAIERRDVIKNNYKIGSITYYFVDDHVRDGLAKALYLLLLDIVILELVLITAIYLALNRLIVRPIVGITRQVNSAADRVREGRLGATSPQENKETIGSRADELGKLHLAMERLFGERTKELTRSNIELKEATERAEDATKLKDKFVSLVSHDLRSPLGGMIGFLGILNKGEEYDLDETRRKAITTNVSNIAEGLVEMIDKLLDISRLKTGKIKVEKSFVNMHDFAAAFVGSLSFQAGEKGVTIVNELPKDKRLFVDNTLFGEVLRNLLSNAIKFTKEGDKITLFEPENSGATLALKDTGSGIDEKIIPDLFKHEIKTSAIGTAGEKGTGLGLPYCSDIIAGHDGTLEVESEIGKGSTFYIKIPEVKAVVMLVDDHEAQRNIIRKHIEDIYEVEIVEAENGKEAMEKLKEVRPHLIITDIMMPEMDGLDLLKEVREDMVLEPIPVIVVTSLTSSGNEGEIELRNMAFSLGANDFLTKPISASEFVPMVRRFLG